MKKLYVELQKYFEKITAAGTLLLSSSISFTAALALVLFWFGGKNYNDVHTDEIVRDIIHAVTFLSLFIIQKEFNHFSASIQVKLNELILSHKPANNAIINVEKKTEHEITKIQEQYAEIPDSEKDIKVEAKNSNNKRTA